MNRLGELDAIAFDIDGTIYPNKAMYRASLPIILSNLRLFRAFGRARRMVRIDPPAQDLRGETVLITARLMRSDPERVAAQIENIVYRQWEEVLRRVELFPGVRRTLVALRNRGYRVGALSDFPLRTKLELFGLSDVWDVMLCSEEVNYLKPHPKPFLRLAELLGADPQKTLYVGNSYRYDVLGARGVGMRTAHLSARSRRDSVADISIAGWNVLAELLLTE